MVWTILVEVIWLEISEMFRKTEKSLIDHVTYSLIHIEVVQ